MDRPLLVANWKAYPTVADALTFAEGLRRQFEALQAVDVILCPPLPLLPVLHDKLAPLPAHIALGAQDVAAAIEPKQTGDTVASLLKSWCKFAIVGHSERRRLHQETDMLVQQKLGQCLQAGLTPIVCVGETVRSADAAEKVAAQLKASVGHLASQAMIIAYEPVWAVGASQPAEVDYAAPIRQKIAELLPGKPILYGGDADATTVNQFLQAGFSGLLLGRASLHLQSFSAVAQAMTEFAYAKH